MSVALLLVPFYGFAESHLSWHNFAILPFLAPFSSSFHPPITTEFQWFIVLDSDLLQEKFQVYTPSGGSVLCP